jgi:UDP-GlcNAc:undecaprenyl-phosphate GlcNAc-1-phosphate transferase
VVAPVLVLLVPLFDTALVTVSRAMSGRSIVEGGRDHSSHRLVAMGWSERSAVAVLWALAAIGGWLGVSVRSSSTAWAGGAAAVVALGMALFAAYLLQVRVYDEPPRGSEAGAPGPSS